MVQFSVCVVLDDHIASAASSDLGQGNGSEGWMLGAQVLLPEGCADAGGRLRVRSLLRAQLRAL